MYVNDKSMSTKLITALPTVIYCHSLAVKYRPESYLDLRSI
jgi:hypothetical protein